MRATFKISPSAAMRKRYRGLLDGDYSEKGFVETLALVRAVVETGGQRLHFPWEAPPGRRPAPYFIPTASSDYLKEYLQRTNDDLRPAVPASLPDGTLWERYAFQSGVLLTFQSRVSVEGATGFLRDAQSLLFLHTVHVALPKLRETKRKKAHDFLVNAAHAHARLVWMDTPGHQYYLLSVLYDHLGDERAVADSLAASLNAASKDDHDFLTKLQAYWSYLIENGNLESAKELVLRVYRSSPPEHLGELTELLDETYWHEGRATSRAS